MAIASGFLRILFAIALFIFLLELFRDSAGVGQVLNDFWKGIDSGYSLEAGAGGGQFTKGQSVKTR